MPRMPVLPEDHYWKVTYSERKKRVWVHLKRHRLLRFPATIISDDRGTYYRDYDLERHMALELLAFAEKAGKVTWKSS